jgi:hypothetical protein
MHPSTLDYQTQKGGYSYTARCRASGSLNALGTAYVFAGLSLGFIVMTLAMAASVVLGFGGALFWAVALCAGLPLAMAACCFVLARGVFKGGRVALLAAMCLAAASLGLWVIAAVAALIVWLGAARSGDVACVVLPILVIGLFLHGHALITLVQVLRSERKPT